MGKITILNGHVIDKLAELPDESVHCVVTSPPYYGLRDYGIEPQVWGGDPACENQWGEGAFCRHCRAWRGSLGLEPTLDLYLDHIVEVFRGVRRVLRKDATCWLNIGDSYTGGGGFSAGAPSSGESKSGKYGLTGALKSGGIKPRGSFKPKDLMLIPSRLAIRLQEDGWWVRSDIAWCKRAPMPESCTDRPTTAWEHVFLLTKSARYFYDAEAVKEEASDDPISEARRNRKDYGAVGSNGLYGTAAGQSGKGMNANARAGKRNMRNFWLLGPEPYPEAHFAVYPTEIPRRAILAGTSARGVCPQCASPWARVTKRIDKGWDGSKYGERVVDASGGAKDGGTARSTLGSANGKLTGETETIGWRPTCECPVGNPVPATVLDPFLGAGTTALVADRLGRDCIGIELSPKYATMAERRIHKDAGMFAEIVCTPG